jgi:hypothetical protein
VSHLGREVSHLGRIGRGAAVAAVTLLVLTGCGAASHPSAAAGASTAGSSRGGAVSTTSTRTRQVPRRPRYHGPRYPVFSGLGALGPRWHAVVHVRGRIAAWVAQRGGVTMLRFDQKVVRLALHAGSTDPGIGSWPYGDAITGAERTKLVAAFNSGFKLATGAGGWRSGSRTAVPLQTGRASVVTYRNGFTNIGAWGQGVPARQPIASVRQNLYLLVDNGVAASTVSSCIETCWGATVGGVLSVARSALGIDARGRLIYGAAASATPATLAQGMIDGGVRRAAELDINPDWVAAYLYRHVRHRLPQFVPVIPGQYGVYGHFLIPYSRDFFAVLAR